MGTRSVYEHLSADDNVARYARHAQTLVRLQRKLDATLPKPLRPYARVANLRTGKLVVHAANSAVAAKIRQLLPRFAEVLQGDSAHVKEIEVKVQAHGSWELAAARATPPRVDKTPPSDERLARIKALADTMSENAALKAPLRALLKALTRR